MYLWSNLAKKKNKNLCEKFVPANPRLSSSLKIMSGSVRMTQSTKSKVLCVVHKLSTLIPLIKDRVATSD